MTQSTGSLRLCEVMEEEYNLLHGGPLPTEYDKNYQITQFKLINTDELLERLKTYPAAAQAPTAPLNPNTLQTHVRYERLAQWLGQSLVQWLVTTETTPQTLPSTELKKLIEKTLKRKLTEPTLLVTDPWLREAPLRPHTRGLLKCYDEQATLPARARQQLAKFNQYVSGISAAPSGVTSSSLSTGDDYLLLNRMLLEDAFVGYVVRYDDERLTDVFGKMYDSHQTALCLSGGGIRSATFALGVVQGLARHKLLDRFTYLSTVSGGGYLGGWLSAWIHHEGLNRVNEKLNGYAGTPLEPEAVPLRHLRQFSNYLSPQVGLLSADTWTLLMTYLRNLLLVWLVLLPLLAALAAVPWVFVTLASFRIPKNLTMQANAAIALSVLATLFTLVGTTYVHAARPLSEQTGSSSIRLFKRDQPAFLRWCLIPLSAAVLCWTLAWRLFESAGEAYPWLARFQAAFNLSGRDGLVIYSISGWKIMGGAAAVHLVSWLTGIRLRGYRRSGWKAVGEAVAVLITGTLAGNLLLLTIKLLLGAPWGSYGACAYTCLAFPGIVATVLLAGFVFEGVTSRFTNDGEREWSARYGAWFLIAATGWLFLTALVLAGPVLVEAAQANWAIPSLVSLISGGLTALLGRSSLSVDTSGGSSAGAGKAPKPGIASLLTRITLPIAAMITLVALFVTLSFFNMAVLRWWADASRATSAQLTRLNPSYPICLLASLTSLGFLFGWLVDTNRFSLHAMYRSRLIRAYLGASRPPGERHPDPFTGFDENDNMPMGQMPDPNSMRRTPFHVINIALNLVAGGNLAWQERKAESFTVSSRHAGALYLGYRRTYVDSASKPPRLYGGKEGISLGTAMTISGAAASPNHGYSSSPLVAFLMTLFNIRLGWWLGNPGPAGDKVFHQSAPTSAIKPILDEMLGNTDNINDYVYLSDGGHFENLGLYEMVLRRNRFILISDASCDETCGLEDLGNAIRKIRVDLGITIDFPHGFDVRARTDALIGSSQYWAIGRIGYSKAGTTNPTTDTSFTVNDGVLLYVKPSFLGTEPRDIFNYASAQKAFPHETTADQFFTESQFESYRALGSHALEAVDQGLIKMFELSLSQLFDKDAWATCVNALNNPIIPKADRKNHNGKATTNVHAL